MINSSYGFYNNINDVNHSFEIDRKRLFDYIKKNTDLSCYYDNTQHQGVKINFMFNEDRNGICKCKQNCILVHKKNRKCKKITILIFNSAKVVITGSNSFEHTKLCYDFINKIILDNYKNLFNSKSDMFNSKSDMFNSKSDIFFYYIYYIYVFVFFFYFVNISYTEQNH